jgi:hypothetical protein
MSALGHKRTYTPQQAMSALHPIATTKADMCQWSCLLYPRKRTYPSGWCEPGHAGLICSGLEDGSAAQESCVMLLRPQFNHYCEVVGRASAFVAFVTMASLILAATAVDVLR